MIPQAEGGERPPTSDARPNRGAPGRKARGPEAPRAAPPSQERAARRRPQPDQEGAPPGDPDPERERRGRGAEQTRTLNPFSYSRGGC